MQISPLPSPPTWPPLQRPGRKAVETKYLWSHWPTENQFPRGLRSSQTSDPKSQADSGSIGSQSPEGEPGCTSSAIPPCLLAIAWVPLWDGPSHWPMSSSFAAQTSGSCIPPETPSTVTLLLMPFLPWEVYRFPPHRFGPRSLRRSPGALESTRFLKRFRGAAGRGR